MEGGKNSKSRIAYVLHLFVLNLSEYIRVGMAA